MIYGIKILWKYKLFGDEMCATDKASMNVGDYLKLKHFETFTRIVMRVKLTDVCLHLTLYFCIWLDTIKIMCIKEINYYEPLVIFIFSFMAFMWLFILFELLNVLFISFDLSAYLKKKTKKTVFCSNLKLRFKSFRRWTWWLSSMYPFKYLIL